MFWGNDDVYSTGRLLVYCLGVERQREGSCPRQIWEPREDLLGFLLEGK